MFSMKGKYVKGEDLTKVIDDIIDVRDDSEASKEAKIGQVEALVALNLISKDKEAYILAIVNK